MPAFLQSLIKRFRPDASVEPEVASILSPHHETPEMLDATPCVRLEVLSGNHEGAVEFLTVRSFSIGSSIECDIVLSDSKVHEKHLEISYSDQNKWILNDLVTGSTIHLDKQSADQKKTSYHITCGSVYIKLNLDVGKENPEVIRVQQRNKRTQQVKDFEVIETRNALIKSIVTGVLITAGIVSAIYWESIFSNPSKRQQLIEASTSLPKAGFSEVRMELKPNKQLSLTGFVANEKQAKDLEKWIKSSAFKDASFDVLVVSRLLNRLEQDLDGSGISVSYQGKGRFIAEGTTKLFSVKNKLQEFIHALHGAIVLDDRIAYLEDIPKAIGQTRPMNMRIVNISLGEYAYFQTDVGSRYFVGSVLPDGAVVIAIDENKITFKMNESEIIYPIQ
jgi:hypothetical protein